MEILFLIGRILFGGFFLLSAFNHFTKTSMIAGFAASRGLPMAKLSVGVSGLLMLLGGLGVILGVYIEWAVAFLVIFLVLAAFTIHKFWQFTDPMQKMTEKIFFLRNIALIGASLMLLAIPQPWAFSVL